MLSIDLYVLQLRNLWKRNKELQQAARALCEELSEECADGLAPGPSISNAWANLLTLLPKEEPKP